MPKLPTRTATRSREANATVEAPGEISRSVTMGGKGNEREIANHTEHVSRVIKSPTPAYVRQGVGLTLSLGPGTYEFARFDLAVEMPCEPNVEAVRETRAEVADLVREMLNEDLVAAGFDPR